MSAARSSDPARELVDAARASGPAAVAARLAGLARLAGCERVPAAALAPLQGALLHLAAHPDDARVHAGARAGLARLRAWVAALPRGGAARLADSGLPGSATVDTFGLPLLVRLARLFPGSLAIDWDTFDDTGALQAAVMSVLAAAEVPGLDDITLEWDDWFAAARTRADQTDLEILLELFAHAPLAAGERELRFDGCGIPVRWRHAEPGSARSEVVWPCERPFFRRATQPPPANLAALVRRPPPRVRRLAPADGERFVDFALAALAVRQSEIRPLSHGNAHDVVHVEAGRGLVVALVGVEPGYREGLESLYTVLLLRNGVPIAYGPASVAAGCTEMGLNLFDEFRGVETRWLYAQYMRALFHVLGSRHFYLTAYGMGAGNPDAIAAGSFWFYRRLGFRPANPAVETLARTEEARFARSPGTRSSPAMLRRLAEGSVHLDLSRGSCTPLPHGPIGLAVTHRIAHEHRGDRERARRLDARAVQRALGAGRLPAASLALLAPVLALDAELAHRPSAERARLARFLRAKAAPAETGADAELLACPGFLTALRAAGSAVRA